MDWHYLSEHQERIPVPEERLRALALGGVLRPTTLLWRRGMSGWQSCGEVRPELFAPPTPAELALPAEDTRSPAAQLALQRIGEGVRPYLPWIGACGWISVIGSALLLIAAIIAALFLALAADKLKLRLIDAGLSSSVAEDQLKLGLILGGTGLAAIVGILLGIRLIRTRRQLTRSWIHGSVEELQRALSGFGAYFTTQAATVATCILIALGVVVYRTWPEKKKADEPKETPKVEAAPKQRTTI